MLLHMMNAISRIFRRQLSFTLINVVSLSLGLVVAVLSLIFVTSQLGINSQIEDSRNVYRLNTSIELPGRAPTYYSTSPAAIAEGFSDQFDTEGVEASVRFIPSPASIVTDNLPIAVELLYLDAGFVDVFSPIVLEGNLIASLSDVNSVVLTREYADIIFGQKQPALGETLTISDYFGKRDFQVGAVIETPRTSDSRQYGVMAAMNVPLLDQVDRIFRNWTFVASDTFFKLRPGIEASDVEAALERLLENKAPDINLAGQNIAVADIASFELLALNKLHLFAGPYAQVGAGSIFVVVTFGVVGMIALLIACANFINLASAAVSTRFKEAAVRKVVGASRENLLVLFMVEIGIVVLISAILAEILLIFSLPILRENYGIPFDGQGMSLMLFGIASVTGVLVGLFPAFTFANVRPIEVLRNRSGTSRASRLRSGLVFAQFAIAVTLMVCTTVVVQQTNYFQNKDLGYEADGILVAEGLSTSNIGNSLETMKQRLLAENGIQSVTVSATVPGDQSDINAAVRRDGSTEPVLLGRHIVDHDFAETYRVEVIAGRNFDPVFSADDTSSDGAGGSNILINESASRALGFPVPEQAIGGVLIYAQGGVDRPVTIIGVMDDYHEYSLHKPIRPSFFLVDQANVEDLSIRFQGIPASRAQTLLESIWRDMLPDQPLSSFLLVDHLANGYASEVQQSRLLILFAIIAIVIAFLGLYGLAAFSVVRRTKEISIRRIVGGTIFQVMTLTVWRLLQPVLFAVLVAWPVSYVISRRWLNQFAYRIDLEPLVFIAAAAVALIIALLAAGSHSFRVAVSKPMNALRQD